MRTYVKKNNQLINLGEGRVYSKKSIALREADTGITAVANPGGGNFGSEGEAFNDIKHELQKPGVTQVQVTKNDLPVAAHKSQDPSLQDTNTEIKASNLTPDTLTKIGNDGQGEITVTKENKTTKKLIEIRRNSIPFSKKELGAFLRTL